MELALHRTEVGVAKRSEDMVAGSLEQVQSAKQKTCLKLTVHTKCSTECQVYLGNSWSGQNLQIRVSLGAGDDGKITWAKPETC